MARRSLWTMDDSLWTRWRILIENARPAAEHMALDERLAQEEVLTLRAFAWHPPAISFGLRQPPPEWLRTLSHDSTGLDVVERPTGGGIAFHGSDVSVSVIVPRRPNLTLETLMGAVCEATVRLCRSYGLEATAALHAPSAGRVTYCLTQPSPYAVCIGARKIAGFALRRFPRTWLIQGSLLVRSVPEALRAVIPTDVAQELTTRGLALSEGIGALVSEQDVATRWAARWPAWWDDALVERLAVAA